MANTMENFLFNYFALLNMQKMPDGALTRFNEFIKKNDFPNDNVKKWENDFFVADPANPGKKKVKEDLPDINTIDNFEIDQLYRAFHDVFSSMARNRDNFQGKDNITKFIDQYFGPGKLFEPKQLDSGTKDEITKIVDLLLTNSELRTAARMSNDQYRTLQAIKRDPKEIDNQKAQDAIQDMVRNIQSELYYGNNTGNLQKLLTDNHIDIEKIDSGLKKEINVKRDDFKNNFADLFKTLYSKGAIYEAFKANDQSQTISRQIDNALSYTDYTGKKNEANYIAPKYEDDPNWYQKLEKGMKDTYSDVLKKYLTLHRANLFIKPEAKAIFEAFDAKGVKPTDGLKAVLEKSGDIANSLKGKQPFNAAGHLKWMTEKLTEYDKNGMGKAIETALYNGHQMNHIIEQLVIDAVKNGKVKEAKTAMEVLSVMQYGLLTSKTMDNINNTDMTLFSDGKLSWNKNEGVKFVTGALDKTIKFGIQGVGYGITMAANGINRSRAKFNHGGKLNDVVNQQNTKFANERANFTASKPARDAADNKEIADNTAIRNGLGIADLAASKAKLAADRATENAQRQDFDNKNEIFAEYTKVDTDYASLEDLKNKHKGIEAEIAKTEALLSSMPGTPSNQLEATKAEEARAKLKEQQEALKANEAETEKREKTYESRGGLMAVYAKNHSAQGGPGTDPFTVAKNNRDAAETLYNATKDANDKLSSDIDTYELADSKIAAAQKRLNDRDAADKNWDADHKNEYEELMAYWDFLQSGNTKSLFHWSTKNLQDKMDKGLMQKRMIEWKKANSYSA